MADFKEMLYQARKVCEKAYSPYSKFKVGVCIRTPNNQLFTGCNVENASYGLSSCAEASAISAMISANEHKIAEVLIVSSGKKACPPCGGCRQRLWEFGDKSTIVHMCDEQGEPLTVMLGDLLPYNFDANNLDKI